MELNGFQKAVLNYDPIVEREMQKRLEKSNKPRTGNTSQTLLRRKIRSILLNIVFIRVQGESTDYGSHVNLSQYTGEASYNHHKGTMNFPSRTGFQHQTNANLWLP